MARPFQSTRSTEKTVSDMLFYLEFFDISLRTSVSRAAY
ncbi:hypothetical protein Q669_27660 [Labrenzia sp. C1B10]|nr:hypothetical protein Q669_27660 [Labrenzia sp. C1B10]ERP99041.1 hypothetical protein Q675_15240 [Labrenzia sp. C1B70]